MKKGFSLLSLIMLTATSITAQSVINKFLHQTFVLNDSNKFTEGNYYAAQSYRFVKVKF